VARRPTRRCGYARFNRGLVAFWRTPWVPQRPSAAFATHLSAHSVGRRQIEQTQTFSLLTELAIALGGFAGVAAAFGGRDRAYSISERIRLMTIFLSAGGALAGSLCVLAFASAGALAGPAFVWASALAAIAQLAHLRIVPTAYRLAIDPEASTLGSTLALLIAYVAVSLGLLLMNAAVWREAWPLVAAFSVQLVWGLWVFFRILTQRD